MSHTAAATEDPGEEEHVDVGDKDSVQFAKKHVKPCLCGCTPFNLYANDLVHSVALHRYCTRFRTCICTFRMNYQLLNLNSK